MNEKTYKARVEISMVVEIDVVAVHEASAAPIAEEIAMDLAAKMTQTIEEDRDSGDYVAAWGVRCTDVEEADYE